ncbi:UmoA family flagellar biogenesis regulator [Morganella morganii]|uniref:UmoA family flagellar biogenesis regulator n=1 Tax=Morganella morganii TaxID=582 RepID=UPI0034E5B27F
MKQMPMFLLLTVLACGSASATWPQIGRSDFSERYEVITLTPDMPVPGAADNDPATKGLRLIGLRRDGNGEYTEVTRQFSPGATKHIRYKGRQYRVVGDVYRADNLSDTGRWDKGQSVVTEEYYEILDKNGKRTGKGFRFSRWD